MASFALHSFFQDISVTECNRQQGKDIIEAIKYNPDRVFIIEVNITSAVDVRYLVEISRLPDFNKVSATHKAVLAALIRFVRLRLYPSTCKLTNLALWDVAFLQGLHSQLLQRVADSAAPRVLSVWLDYNRADNIASLCRSCCRAADAISSGNLESFKALVQTERQRVASFALQQLPDLHGWTFLHLLVSCTQHTEEVAASFMEFLLSNSVNLNAVDYANRTALHVACEHFHLPAILLLATHPLSCVTALNSHGKIPLQVFLGQLKVHRHVPDYQQLVRVVQALTPYEDYTALLLNCSASSFRPGLLRGLLHSSREVAYFCINKLSGLVIASGTRSEGYLAVYTTLVYCVKHCVNFYFSQLIDIMKGMASSQDWQLAEWQLFCAMVHYGTLHRNVVAIYWAVDHLCRHTSFDSEDVDMAARMGLLAKHSLLQAVRLEDDKLLASLIRKLPVVFTVVLLTESGATSSPNSVKQFQAVEYISAEDRDVLQQYSLLELACAHHAPSSLAVLLKHLHIHSRHAPDLYANAYRDALAVSVCTADLVCIDTFRDCLGMEVLAGLLFSSGKIYIDLSLI
ncbi:ankyrin repeat domain-containing protein [archaeon]|nr:MAG: ankyrin repeat domain-containing protein [archaeon]